MQEINWIAILVAALVPLFTGFVWYHPNVLGTAWKKASGVTMEEGKGGNMGLIFGLTFLLSFIFAIFLQFMVIHQFSVFSLLANEPGIQDPNAEIHKWLMGFMEKHGNNFRTFKHGCLHGFMGGLTIALPILAINAMFERKSFKYIAINTGYWAITMMLMGGIICAWQ